jgi:hypothetical protein
LKRPEDRVDKERPRLRKVERAPDYVQAHISSSVDVWQRERTLRTTLSSLKLRLRDAVGG